MMAAGRNDPQQRFLEHLGGTSQGLNVLLEKVPRRRWAGLFIIFSKFVTILFFLIISKQTTVSYVMELAFLISLLIYIEVFCCSPNGPHHRKKKKNAGYNRLLEQPQQYIAHTEGLDLSQEKEPALDFLLKCFGVVCLVQSRVHCDPHHEPSRSHFSLSLLYNLITVIKLQRSVFAIYFKARRSSLHC